MAKNTCSTLRIVFMAFLVSISLKSVHGVCEIDQNLTDSTVYALSITEDGTPFRVAVMIYSKNCTDDIDAVGPNWYRLEVIGSEENLGRFEKPWEYSGAVRRNEGIEFYSEEPLALYDLPRRYKWETNPFEEDYPSKLCFRLVIRHGDSCEQVVTSNCTEELQQHIMDLQSKNGSTEGAPTTAATTEEVTTEVDPIKLLQCIRMNPRLNCTGKRVKPTCGSDGMWYKNTCTLRLQRCLYETDLAHLQRDLSNISCTDSPPTFFPPPPPPPTMAPPTPQPCSEQRQEYLNIGFPLVPRCLDHAAFRPVQCTKFGGTTRCDCVDPYTGAYYFTYWYPHCSSRTLTQPPPLRCVR